MHKELIRTEFDGAFCQKFELLVDRFSSFLVQSALLWHYGTMAIRCKLKCLFN